MAIKDKIKKELEYLNEEQLNVIDSLIATWAVEPDKFDQQMYREYLESSDEDKEYVSEEEAMKELNL